MKKIEVLGLQTIPEIKQGDNLAEIIVKCVNDEIGGLEEEDIIVLTSKIVSKASGRIRKLGEVKPGKRALASENSFLLCVDQQLGFFVQHFFLRGIVRNDRFLFCGRF